MGTRPPLARSPPSPATTAARRCLRAPGTCARPALPAPATARTDHYSPTRRSGAACRRLCSLRHGDLNGYGGENQADCAIATGAASGSVTSGALAVRKACLADDPRAVLATQDAARVQGLLEHRRCGGPRA